MSELIHGTHLVPFEHKGKTVSLRVFNSLKLETWPLDESIKELLLDLNSAGFVTEGSCAGHSFKKKPGWQSGWISFSRNLSRSDKSRVKDIFLSNGIDSVRFKSRSDGSNKHTIASFRPIDI